VLGCTCVRGGQVACRPAPPRCVHACACCGPHAAGPCPPRMHARALSLHVAGQGGPGRRVFGLWVHAACTFSGLHAAGSCPPRMHACVHTLHVAGQGGPGMAGFRVAGSCVHACACCGPPWWTAGLPAQPRRVCAACLRACGKGIPRTITLLGRGWASTSACVRPLAHMGADMRGWRWVWREQVDSALLLLLCALPRCCFPLPGDYQWPDHSDWPGLVWEGDTSVFCLGVGLGGFGAGLEACPEVKVGLEACQDCCHGLLIIIMYG
jgi:hypothetical protein